MKFLFSDTQDYVDPGYDFINDRNAPGRKRYWGDRYPHELMDTAPYDGLLVSMSAVKSVPHVTSGASRYSTAEEQRFLRDGARKFLRFGGAAFADNMLMGDCGAFAYAELAEPAYTPAEVFEFYVDGGFTHGCSPDHIIFAFDETNPTAEKAGCGVVGRYRTTLKNAEEFLALSNEEGRPFEPLGAVQGWSPESMADAAADLERMGYSYLAIGGLVPLRTDSIHSCLNAIRARIRPETKLHLLGFAKAEQIHEFTSYGIASFDSTSPLIRAFKDARANYYLESPKGGLEYFAAVRIPQAMENPRLMQAIKRGQFKSEELQEKEIKALWAIRGYDRGEVSLSATVDTLTAYQKFFTIATGHSVEKQQREIDKNRERVYQTLSDAPWKRCGCAICRQIGVEVIIFRSSNRNKRRGFHNLGVYYGHLKRTVGAAQ